MNVTMVVELTKGDNYKESRLAKKNGLDKNI